MKILIINCVFPPEPVVSAKIGSQLAESLSEDNGVTVITPKSTRPYGFKFIGQDQNIKPYNLFRLDSYTHPQSGIFGRLRESISFGIASYKFIKNPAHSFDVVYMNTWPIFAQLGVMLACKARETEYIVHIQDIYPESLANKLPHIIKFIAFLILFPIEKMLMRNAKKIIAISETMQQYLFKTRRISFDKIDIVTNWQDETSFTLFRNVWPSTEQKITFMYLGNIGPVAGVDFLISSFAKSGVNGRLIIAGSGSEKDACIKKAEEFSHADICFVEVPEGKVAEVQSHSHVLVLPTKRNIGNNSIPSKLPAYMFSARPILALADKNSDIGICIKEANCGWLGNPEDESWLINCFKEICQLENSVLKEKGNNAFIYAKDKFSKEKNLIKLTSIITSNDH
jgi:glycosyltransferase involved in cell wall biosynthesis